MANRNAVIETNKGTITIVLYEDEAPITAGNFIDLVQKGFYDGLTFHRYEPGFVQFLTYIGRSGQRRRAKRGERQNWKIVRARQPVWRK
jgi:cyclophilin family peptidyl-prolyl cis-trans isomerase